MKKKNKSLRFSLRKKSSRGYRKKSKISKFRPINSFKKLSRRRRLMFILIFALIGGGIWIWAQAAVFDGPYGVVESDQMYRLNATRSANGKSGMQHIECLNSVAQEHSREMAERDRLYHTGDDNYDGTLTTEEQRVYAGRVDKSCGKTWSRIGENVGVATYSNSPQTSRELFDAFMNSPRHKVNILGDYTKAGMGAYKTTNGMLYLTQLFAKCTNCNGNWGSPAIVGGDPGPPVLAISTATPGGYPTADSTVSRGQTLAIRINVSNSGNGTANNAIIENGIPNYSIGSFQSGFAISGISGTSTGGSASTYYYWKMNTFASGGGGYVDMRLQVKNDAPSGAKICNSASIRADNASRITTAPICFTVSGTTSPPPPASGNDILGFGQSMSKTNTRTSTNGSTVLALQGDGNLVLYQNGGVRFATYTTTGNSLNMQSDCNLVLYNSSGGAIWSSGTYGRGSSCFLKVQDDGKIGIYNSANTFIWQTP